MEDRGKVERNRGREGEGKAQRKSKREGEREREKERMRWRGHTCYKQDPEIVCRIQQSHKIGQEGQRDN